jgi:hypothetical protein
LKAQIAQGEKIEQPKLAYIPKTIQTTRVSLRKAPGQLNERHIKNMLLKYHFFDVERNPAGNFTNDYIVNPDGTITDRVTGLIWQKSGSMKRLLWVEAANYVQKMNNQRFAGYSDWRLPTVEELASLMMRNKKQGLYLSSVFDSRQKKCWSADSFSSDTLSYAARYQSAWIVEFVGGYIEWARWSHSAGSGSGHTGDSAHTKNLNNYVRAVRSLE